MIRAPVSIVASVLRAMRQHPFSWEQPQARVKQSYAKRMNLTSQSATIVGLSRSAPVGSRVMHLVQQTTVEAEMKRSKGETMLGRR
jgi:hypothetical protein